MLRNTEYINSHFSPRRNNAKMFDRFFSSYFFQSQSKSCKGNVISIDTPWKTICSEESALAGLILSDAVIKQFTGSLGDAGKKNSGPPFTVKIESNKNGSTKRKRTED